MGCGLRGNCARIESPRLVLVFFAFGCWYGVEQCVSIYFVDDSYRAAGHETYCSIRSDECLDYLGHNIVMRDIVRVVVVEEVSDSAGCSCLCLVLEEDRSVEVGILCHTSL